MLQLANCSYQNMILLKAVLVGFPVFCREVQIALQLCMIKLHAHVIPVASSNSFHGGEHFLDKGTTDRHRKI